MGSFRLGFALATYFLCMAVHASDAAQTCNDMYPVESYDAQERDALVQDCLQSYSTDSSSDFSEPAEPSYYEGTVEDYVNDMPAEEPAPEMTIEEPIDPAMVE